MQRIRRTLLALAALTTLAGCATDERQWLKLNEKYTTEEFRRDHAECSRSGRLDDACMRQRGWVAVNPAGKAEQPKDPLARELGPPSQRTRY